MSDERPSSDSNNASPVWAIEWAAHFLTTACAFVGVWLIATVCASTISVDVDRISELLPSLAVQQEFIAPEPAERTAYACCLLGIPLLMLFIHPLIRAKVSRISKDGLWKYFLASCIVMLFLVGWGALGDGGFYWSGSLLYTNPLGFVLATTAGVAFAQFPLSKLQPVLNHRRLPLVRDLGLAMAVVAFIGMTSVLRVFSGTDPYVADNHFEAVFFTTTQVSLGATLLVDCPHQYGLYPEFLSPVFKLLGGITVLRFTVVMALLQAVAYSLWLAAMFRVMRTRWMAMLTFIGAFSLVSFLVPLFVIRQNIIPYYDPYFQYFPIRTLFPAIALYAMAWITEGGRFNKRLARCVGSAILGAGVLWNADAGIPALGAWVLCLCHQAIVRHPPSPVPAVGAIATATAIALEALLAAAATITLGLAALAWKAGAWPDPTMYWRHHKVFYEIGFFMLPMRLMHSWVAWVAVIMATLSFGIWPLSSTVRDENNMALRSTLFGWAVLGCGLFSYYQGRSHDWVFPVVLPIALVLVGVVIARVALPTAFDPASSHKWKLASATLTTAFIVVMASGAVGPWWNDSLLWKIAGTRWQRLMSPATESGEPNAVQFLKQRLEPGEEVLILSNHAGIYHAETKTKSMLPGSLVELVLRSDRDKLLQRVAKAKRVFADRSVLVVQTPNTNQETNALITTQLAERFHSVSASSDDYILELVPNLADALDDSRVTN